VVLIFCSTCFLWFVFSLGPHHQVFRFPTLSHNHPPLAHFPPPFPTHIYVHTSCPQINWLCLLFIAFNQSPPPSPCLGKTVQPFPQFIPPPFCFPLPASNKTPLGRCPDTFNEWTNVLLLPFLATPPFSINSPGSRASPSNIVMATS